MPRRQQGPTLYWPGHVDVGVGGVNDVDGVDGAVSEAGPLHRVQTLYTLHLTGYGHLPRRQRWPSHCR